ncbi:MAG: DEAD/DEAH box helicase [Fimbriimonadaceae bacterium]|nr:DEAD/DEAH box helicase [Fimbriimonadaceae bacterium]
MSESPNQSGFADLGLPPHVLDRVERLGFTTPTPIQAQAVPVALTGRDLVGVAETGTGKTMAFGLPIAAHLSRHETALVLAPTRELALQIEESLVNLGLKCVALIGGASISVQVHRLRSRPQVIVATPGRLIDHLNQDTVRLDHVAVVVLDEADRMLDMGFAPAVDRVLATVPRIRQTMLFSATMPDAVLDVANRHMTDPVRVEVSRPGTAARNVQQELYVVEHEDKPGLLKSVLDSHDGPTLVFARTRHGARKLAKSVRSFGHSAAEIHADRTLAQRREALDGFKSGEYRVLVATDIAARGIDVKDIALVVNYDVPDNPEDYVHRIGRTGRAGAEGKAVTFALPDQHADVRGIEKAMDARLPLSPDSKLSMARHARPPRVFRPAGGPFAKRNQKRRASASR